MKKLTNKELKNKQKLIENMDISLGELLNEIHYMEIAVERMKEKFENRGEHYLSIIEHYIDTVKFYRFDFFIVIILSVQVCLDDCHAGDAYSFFVFVS